MLTSDRLYRDITTALVSGRSLTSIDPAAYDTIEIEMQYGEMLARHEGFAELMLREIRAGRIDGSKYVPDERAKVDARCIVGKLAEHVGISWKDLSKFDRDPLRSPIVRLCYAIRPGDTPKTSRFVRLLEVWTLGFIGAGGCGQAVRSK